MPDVFFPLDAQDGGLDIWLDTEYPLVFHLFAADLTPDELFDLDTLAAAEATYPGYVVQSIMPPAAGQDTVALTTSCGPIAVGFPGPSDSSSPTVYGWFATKLVGEGSDSVLVACQRFDDAPLTIVGSDAGPIFAFTARMRQVFVEATYFDVSVEAPSPGNILQDDTFTVSIVARDQFGGLFDGYNNASVCIGFAWAGTASNVGMAGISNAAGDTFTPQIDVVDGVGSLMVYWRTAGSGTNFNELLILVSDDTISGTSGQVGAYW